MTKGRETTQAERIAVAKACVANGKNYGEVAIQHNVSYQQARSWTLKYIEGGESALEDRRGQRKKDQQPRTELEQAQIKIELKHKLKILDLYDRRIVSYIIRDRNDNPLVFDTLDAAIAANPNAHPLFHSDRGFQYTNRAFYNKLKAAKMKQSMSRVAKCIDNGPMEGFWGILKRERYYGRRFTSREELVSMIENYITYYNNRRVQRNLGVLTPMEKHEQHLMAA